jgi:hypothetical protein
LFLILSCCMKYVRRGQNQYHDRGSALFVSNRNITMIVIVRDVETVWLSFKLYTLPVPDQVWHVHHKMTARSVDYGRANRGFGTLIELFYKQEQATLKGWLAQDQDPYSLTSDLALHVLAQNRKSIRRGPWYKNLVIPFVKLISTIVILYLTKCYSIIIMMKDNDIILFICHYWIP